MFAGKTARLIARLAAAEAAGRRVVAFKHRLDTRYDARRLMTHDARSFPAVAAGGAGDVLENAGPAECVGIDEAQFFGRPLVGVCRGLVEEGRCVIVAGIDHDAWGQDFPPLPELKAVAHEVELLHVPCTVCGQPARYSQRMVPVVAGQMVGGPGEYEPRCRTHFAPLSPPAPVYR